MTDTTTATAADLISLGITIADGVAQAIPEAVAAFGLVQQMVAANRDPTPEEWATLDAAADAYHKAIQAAAPASA